MRTGGIHELLPWYVNGTLSADEAAAFTAHLSECADCEREMEMMHAVRAEVEEHREAVFGEHPPAEQLVAVAHGTADTATTASVVQHVRLCSTCEIEMGWITGDPERSQQQAPRPARAAWWTATAAAAVAALTLWAPWRTPGEPSPGVLQPQYLPEPQRGGARPSFALSPATGRFTAYFVVDFPREAYPVLVLLRRADGGAELLSYEIEAPEQLAQELYSYLDCPASVCSDGAYEIVLRSVRGDVPEQRIPFELSSRP